MPEYRIHGDNIVECERTLALIMQALQVADTSVEGPLGSPLTPSFSLTTPLAADRYRFTFLPGYGRWDQDILEILRRRGGLLREAADAILCRVDRGFEVPLVAIEYCGALPAGNQAWQRNGRALSFAHAKLPYLYIAELSGYELNAQRERKAARMPNPVVPFSYLLLTESTKSLALPIFVRSPGASHEAVRGHTPFYGEQNLLDILRGVILGTPLNTVVKALETKVLALVQYLAGSRRRNDTLSAELWAAALAAVAKGQSLPSFLAQNTPITWAKTAYIEGLTSTAGSLMATTAQLARGLTSASLPLCLILEKDRTRYTKAIQAIYPQLPSGFAKWCSGPGHLAVCWVMGFKPRGDDARPDRGLPPLCRMLVGEKTDMLTVIYGPAPAPTWPLLATNPAALMERNGLWEAALVCSDAVLIDTSTLPTAPPATYLSSHWAAAVKTTPVSPFIVTPAPIRAGENDVDTVLHLLFARLASPDVFEGMCNPPGGDWSGVSLLSHDRTCEFRWLGLPRVTAAGAKRPDHVFQLFKGFTPFLVLAVESKERASAVEAGIGPCLVKYVTELVRTRPSVQRSPGAVWNHYTDAPDRSVHNTASAAAFVLTTQSELQAVAGKARADVVFGVAFSAQNDACTVHVKACTATGQAVAAFVEALSFRKLQMAVRIHS
jgi:hypothetical protein